MQADRCENYRRRVCNAIAHLASIAKDDFGLTGDVTLDSQLAIAVRALREAERRLMALRVVAGRAGPL